jgi:hypothetical protein
MIYEIRIASKLRSQEKRKYEAENRSPMLNFVRAHTSGTSRAGNQFA